MEIGSTAWNVVGVLLGLYLITSGLSAIESSKQDKATHEPLWIRLLQVTGALMIAGGFGMFVGIGSRFF